MLVGRQVEKERLMEAYNGSESSFVAVYGRRRVGKTYLVRETLADRFAFAHTGVSSKSRSLQLKEFYQSLKRYGAQVKSVPKNWFEAFELLESHIDSCPNKRKVIFIDEMPWMDTPRSSFVSALEHFWNAWAAARKDVLLIICGSASSWIINKVLKNKGGLHNRVSVRILLQPFSLKECEEYCKSMDLPFNRNQICELYMVMGGVPFYWSKLKRKYSVAQNIDELFFKESGEFRHEFDELYASLFNKPEPYIKIVESLGRRKAGMTRGEIIKHSGLEDNGQLTQMLKELSYCGFIRKYCNIGKRTKDSLFQLIDNYTLFYYSFIYGKGEFDENYWSKTTGRPEYNNWCGLAFERLCLTHINQIKNALGISGIISTAHSWYAPASDGMRGAQIDLLIDRSDNVISVCEMKYSKGQFSISSDYRLNLLNKLQRLSDSLRQPRKAVQLIFITNNGLMQNSNSAMADNQLTADELFRG